MEHYDYLRVLYADDHEDTCEMVTATLKFSDIEVTSAKTVAEAWRLAQTEYFDLYLLEIRFPDGDGLELCRRLRECAPHTPIIFYSGFAYEADKKSGLAAGANAYLAKPYTDELAEIISRFRLSKKNSSSNNYTEAQNQNTYTD